MFLFSLSSTLVTLSPGNKNTVVSKEEWCCLTSFYWCLQPHIFYALTQHLLRVGSGVVGVDVSWWLSGGGHRWSCITASSMQHYSLNEASFILPLPDFSLSSSPSLAAWVVFHWIIQLRLYHNIDTGIDALLLFSDMSLCAVQCIEMRGWWEFKGWLTRKEYLHSPFPFCAN